jgi:hypothetical protein
VLRDRLGVSRSDPRSIDEAIQSRLDPNFYQGRGPLNCPDTCRVWTGTKREHEQSRVIDGQSAEASVCKITRDKNIITTPINDPTSHWIYGNQFDTWAMCHVQSLGYGQIRSEYFMCLCVQP